MALTELQNFALKHLQKFEIPKQVSQDVYFFKKLHEKLRKCILKVLNDVLQLRPCKRQTVL
jgi:hypothetical protein